jgi:hypothetical protein
MFFGASERLFGREMAGILPFFAQEIAESEI